MLLKTIKLKTDSKPRYEIIPDNPQVPTVGWDVSHTPWSLFWSRDGLGHNPSRAASHVYRYRSWWLQNKGMLMT